MTDVKTLRARAKAAVDSNRAYEAAVRSDVPSRMRAILAFKSEVEHNDFVYSVSPDYLLAILDAWDEAKRVLGCVAGDPDAMFTDSATDIWDCMDRIERGEA